MKKKSSLEDLVKDDRYYRFRKFLRDESTYNSNNENYAEDEEHENNEPYEDCDDDDAYNYENLEDIYNYEVAKEIKDE